MAGLYPDVPGERIAWDRDGTTAFAVRSTTGEVETWDITRKQALNGEDPTFSPPEIASSNGNGDAQYTVLMFPVLMDIYGFWLDAASDVTAGVTPGSAGAYQWSPNSTNGVDGTWTTIFSNWFTGAVLGEGGGGYFGGDGSFPSKAGMRNNIRNNTVRTGVKALRWVTSHNGGLRIRHVHVFGEPTTDQYLRLWHPTLDQEAAPADFDMGDVAQDTAESRQFRVKNTSGTLSALNVNMALEALTDKAVSVLTQYDLSDDGVNFDNTLALGDLAPGEITPVLYLRRRTAINATLGLGWLRFVAAAATWT